MCSVHDIYGFRQRTSGAWANYMIFPAGALNYNVPETIPMHHAVSKSRLNRKVREAFSLAPIKAVKTKTLTEGHKENLHRRSRRTQRID
jgi:hypothetical protein